MADITREIEITAALSSDYQAAFNAASSIAKSTASELSALTKRGADLARMTELAGQTAKAQAEGDAKAVENLQKEYEKLAGKLGLADKSAEALEAEIKRIGDRRKEIEALNKSASRSAEIGKLAQQIQTYTKAAQSVKDPSLAAALEKMKKRFRELGGVIPDKKKAAGFFSSLKTGAMQAPGPLGSLVRSFSFVGEAFSTAGGKAALAVGGIAAITSAAVAAGKALWGLGKETIAAGDQIAKTSKQLGIASDAYQELAYSVGLGGASEKEFDAALRQLNRQMEAAATGNGKAQKAFAALGVSMAEVKSMNAEEMFVRISDALAEVDDVAAKTRTTMALFGEGGDKVAAAISGGSEALEKMREEARKAGYVLDGKALKQAEEANDNFTRAQLQMQGVVRQIGIEVMPTMNAALQDFVTLIRDNRDTLSEFAGILGDGFRIGSQIAVGAIKAVNVAVQVIAEGFKFWWAWIPEKLEWLENTISDIVSAVGSIPGKVAEMFGSALQKAEWWFARIKESAIGWVTSIVDWISSAVLEKVAWLTDSLRGMPLIGELIGDLGGAAHGGGVTINVSTNVDARGAAPGAGSDVSRAVRSSSAQSGEEIASAFAAYAGLSYSGASR